MHCVSGIITWQFVLQIPELLASAMLNVDEAARWKKALLNESG